MPTYARHFEKSVLVKAETGAVFAFADDHGNFSAHMTKPSWMMGGGSMAIEMDGGRGWAVGSHLRLAGRIFGLALSLEEVVTVHLPPRQKTWETVGTPRLLVIGAYRMGFALRPAGDQTAFLFFIDYDLPADKAWLGQLFGGLYARWCVANMANGVRLQFTHTSQP